MNENEEIEFKENYTDNIYKEIVSFLNTKAGVILVGYDDNGDLKGLENVEDIEEKISNGLKTNISPDARMFVSINILEKENLKYISINVSKGIDIYYLKDKGIVKGTYLRTGSCSIPASEETVKQMIIRNSMLSFESALSLNQDLSFNYINDAFLENNLDLNSLNIKENLHLTKDGKYTNLGLLLSDQNPFSIKLAVYESKEKTNFLDRKEFTGSVLKIYDEIVNYFKLNTAVYGLVDSSTRSDIEEYPEFILREIVLNAIVHRDYGTLTSNIVNLYRNEGIEFISYGSLYGNVTIEDILSGLSVARNPQLQSIFMRIKRVEAIGSGLRRVNSYYQKNNLKLLIKALPSSFVVELPRIEMNKSFITSGRELIIKYVKENESITRQIVEELIGKERTAASDILNELISDEILIKVGNGRSIKYQLKK